MTKPDCANECESLNNVHHRSHLEGRWPQGNIEKEKMKRSKKDKKNEGKKEKENERKKVRKKERNKRNMERTKE